MSDDAEHFLPEAIMIRLRFALLLHRASIGWTAGGALRDVLADSYSDRGVLLQQAEEFTLALNNLDDALFLDPDHAEALNNRGVVLTRLGRPADALVDFDKALSLRPLNPNAWSNRGNALMQLGRFDDAIASHDRAIEIDQEHIAAYLCRGVVLHYRRRFADALADFTTVMRALPEDPGAQFNASLIHLALGDYEAGWALYESRWGMHAAKLDARAFTQPRWDGQADGTVLLWSEQGLGDTLQFCRYTALFEPRTKLVLEVPRSLTRLLRGLPHVNEVVAEGDPLPDFDWHCPMMSLPLAFGTLLDTIPATVPYLHADADQVAHWRERLSSLSGLRVGLVWSGNARPTDSAAHAIDLRRSITAAHYAPLGAIPGVTLISLQKHEEGTTPVPPPPGMTIHDWTDELGDFADTAALVMALDLVITVDTSVAHLVGALGRPVWILNRYDMCWRWLDGREDSPWYPTARLFRQPSSGDWHSVIEEVAGELKKEALFALYVRANDLMQRGCHAEALPVIDDIVTLRPNDPGAYSNRGVMLERLGLLEPALADLDRALSIEPTHLLSFLNRGNVLQQLGRLEEALACADRALEIEPGNVKATIGRSSLLYELGRSDEAIAGLHELLAVEPDHCEALSNLSVMLETSDQLDAALDCCDRALKIDPSHADAWLNRGTLLVRLCQFDDAIACFTSVLAERPDDQNAHYNTGLVQLARGEYAEGWRRHEWRWQSTSLRGASRVFTQPMWRGETIPKGRTILLHAEQGLGDTLQFCRYVPLVARDADVVLEVPRPLHRLLSRLPGVNKTVVQGEALPQFDLHCPLMSLPLAFGTTVETIPSTIPYLLAVPADVTPWRKRIGNLPGLRVGLVWAGNPRPGKPLLNAIDRRRSLALSDYAPLAAIPGVLWVSLQKGAAAEQITTANMKIQDWTAELNDLADTAALVMALDLVITVDTSVAHLAGALGKPVWVLNRFDACWRWLLDRSDSPWYPTARLFRQPVAGDWYSVVFDVTAALRLELAGTGEPKLG